MQGLTSAIETMVRLLREFAGSTAPNLATRAAVIYIAAIYAEEI